MKLPGTAAAILLLALPMGTSALAQDWPTKPIEFNYSGNPGGTSEVISRVVVEPIAKILGQPITMLPKPGGAAGSVSVEATTNLPADGYTFMLSSNTIQVLGPAINKLPNYDPANDIITVGRMTISPCVIYVHNDGPIKSLDDLVAMAKANPGGINFGMAGYGTVCHLGQHMLASALGIEVNTINYKTNPESIAGVLSGELDIGIDNIAGVIAHVTSGNLTPIAVTSDVRVAQLPDVPTVQELGVADFNAALWLGLGFKAGTPEEVLRRFEAAMAEAMADPAVQEQLSNLGATPAYLGYDDMKALLAEELATWPAVIEAAGITAQ